jgi:hypothetical protein
MAAHAAAALIVLNAPRQQATDDEHCALLFGVPG